MAQSMNVQDIDIVMPTWNSNGWWFPNVLDSIMKNCNVCHLIIVDRCSKDRTQEIARIHVPMEKLRIIESEANLATARKIGISEVDTEVFAFVDSDIELCQDWQKKMNPMMQLDNVGAVQGTELDVYDARELNPEVKELIQPSSLTLGKIVRYGLFNLIRGMTTQTLIKTSIVSDWQPGSSLTSFEDFSLTQHVLSRGYKWRRAEGVVSVHHKYPKEDKNKFKLVHDWYLWGGAGARASKAIPFSLIIVNSFARITGAMVRYLSRKVSFEQMILIVLMQVSIVQGYLLSERYIVNYR